MKVGNRRELGSWVELQAQQLLIDRGYRLLRRNHWQTVGELDLLVADSAGGKILLEVRARSSPAELLPGVISRQKLRRLQALAVSWRAGRVDLLLALPAGLTDHLVEPPRGVELLQTNMLNWYWYRAII